MKVCQMWTQVILEKRMGIYTLSIKRKKDFFFFKLVFVRHLFIYGRRKKKIAVERTVKEN